jgi:hypothetical protein
MTQKRALRSLLGRPAAVAAATLWILAFQPGSLPAFVLLNVYLLTLLYALNMRASGDPSATAAILLAVFAAPLAAVLFLLRWADGHREPYG